MACKNAVNYQQEMVDRGTELSNYSSLSQPREEEAIYSEIQQSDKLQNCTDQPKEKNMCNSKLQIILIIFGMVALAVSSCILTAIILQQKIDSLSDKIESMKMNMSGDVVSDKPVTDQESNWLEWTHWSECSVSCSGGIQRRTRTCHGSDKGPHVCVGNDVDISACTNNTCVESNWLEWTNWSKCSVSCSGGIQTRTRTCNGPDKGPHVCVGNDVDIAACNNNTCMESNWLEWTNWSKCSISCSGGIQRRTRTCNGPDKGPHVCVGNDVDISACTNNTCVESNWLEWTNWSKCSVSCSGGIQRRTRTCNGPDKGPHVCVGNDVDIAACNNNTCVVPMVYFTMRATNEQLVSGKVRFVTTISNVGGGYNKATGEFVCPVAGLYHFYFTFVQQSTSNVYCYIKHNGISLTLAYTRSDGTWDAASTSAYIQLAVGDVVTVGACKNWQYVDHGPHSGVFTGSLIHL